MKIETRCNLFATGFGAVILVLGMVGSAACKAIPVVENVAQVVIADFLAGKSQQQIETDACNALGGTSLEDAVCADVAQLVVDIIESAVGKGQLAAAQAQAYLDAHPQQVQNFQARRPTVSK